MVHWMSERKQRSVEIPSCWVKNRMKIRMNGINVTGNDIIHLCMYLNGQVPWCHDITLCWVHSLFTVYIFKPMYYVLIAVIAVTKITIISPHPYCTYPQHNHFPLPLSLCQLFCRYTYLFLPSVLVKNERLIYAYPFFL